VNLEVGSFHFGTTAWAGATFVFVVASQTNVFDRLTLTKESAAFTQSSHPFHSAPSNYERENNEEC
jgi:hypothetical protein